MKRRLVLMAYTAGSFSRQRETALCREENHSSLLYFDLPDRAIPPVAGAGHAVEERLCRIGGGSKGAAHVVDVEIRAHRLLGGVDGGADQDSSKQGPARRGLPRGAGDGVSISIEMRKNDGGVPY